MLYYKSVIDVLCVSHVSHEVGRKRDYSSVSWSEYFEMMDDVVVGSAESKTNPLHTLNRAKALASIASTASSTASGFVSNIVPVLMYSTVQNCSVRIRADRTVHRWCRCMEEDIQRCPGLSLLYVSHTHTHYCFTGLSWSHKTQFIFS